VLLCKDGVGLRTTIVSFVVETLVGAENGPLIQAVPQQTEIKGRLPNVVAGKQSSGGTFLDTYLFVCCKLIAELDWFVSQLNAELDWSRCAQFLAIGDTIGGVQWEERDTAATRTNAGARLVTVMPPNNEKRETQESKNAGRYYSYLLRPTNVLVLLGVVVLSWIRSSLLLHVTRDGIVRIVSRSVCHGGYDIIIRLVCDTNRDYDGFDS